MTSTNSSNDHTSVNTASAGAGIGVAAALHGKGGGMTAMARAKITGRNGALRHWFSRTTAVGVGVLLFAALAGRTAAAQVSDEAVKAAQAAAKHAEEAWAQAAKACTKQTAAVNKAQAKEVGLKADLAALDKELNAAPQEKKDKLSAKLRDLREEVSRASDARASAQSELARSEAQAKELRTAADSAAKSRDDLASRQKTEAAAWAERQAQEKAAAKTAAAAAAPAPAPVAAAAPVAPVVAASAIDQLEARVKQAQADKAQADAVVTQRTQDLANAKDADARKKAESALREAEKYAAGKDKDYKAAVAKLEDARKPVAASPAPAARAPQISEPAAWAPPAAPEPAPVLRADQRLTIPEPSIEEIAPAGTKLQFDATMVAGDRELVEDLQEWKDWAGYVTFNPVGAEEINEFHAKLTKALQEKGYVFAKVTFPTRIWAYGIFLAKVDGGPLGTITVKGNRHYSAQQIINALADKPGARFNYARVHGDLFDLNAKPDLNIDAKLRPSLQNGRRVVDADLEVDDDLPIHGSLELSNTGTKVTNEWRIRSTLQHVNLTKADDVLTAEWLTSPQISDVNAYSMAYFRPLDDRWSMNLYAGLSDSDIQDVLPALDIRGRGHYAGGQLTRTLEETPRYRTQLTGGWLYQYWENEQEISDTNWDDRRLRLSMPSITYGYSSRVFDAYSGRNFASITGLANFAGKYGSSAKEEFIGEGGAGFTDGDFTMARFQLARMQRLFKCQDQPGKWTLFAKIDGQLGGDSLPPPVRRSLGGANSVRGYEEAEVAGDNAVTGTLELRTPLIQNFIPGLKKTDEYLDANPEAWQQHRLQFVLFTDAGWIQNKEPMPGEMDSETLASIGAGLRLGFTKYSQMRVDYALPLEDTTDDTPSSGRVHLSLQLQF